MKIPKRIQKALDVLKKYPTDERVPVAALPAFTVEWLVELGYLYKTPVVSYVKRKYDPRMAGVPNRHFPLFPLDGYFYIRTNKEITQ